MDTGSGDGDGGESKHSFNDPNYSRISCKVVY